jgi:hypothetical protein
MIAIKMNSSITTYHQTLPAEAKAVCEALAGLINCELTEAESKVWHAHPVWFIEGNPIVGYSLQQRGVRLMFWSGASFEEPLLNARGAKFKDASIFYSTLADIKEADVNRWLKLSREIQWDYQHIVKRKGRLERLK